MLLFLFEKVAPDMRIYNKRHEMLKESVIASLNNEAMYQNHFNLHSIIPHNKETMLFTVIQELQQYQSLE
jgi:hypothetical protein